MYCSQCATEIPEHGRYCPNCAAPQAGAPPSERTPEPKISIRRGVSITVLLMILCFFGYVYYSQNIDTTAPPIITSPHTVQLFVEEASVIKPGNYRYVKFTVPEHAKSVRVDGSFNASGGSGNDVEVFIVDENGFVNFQNDHSANTFYNSGKVTADDLNVQLPSPEAVPATYYLILSNTFSLISNKVVDANIILHYDR